MCLYNEALKLNHIYISYSSRGREHLAGCEQVYSCSETSTNDSTVSLSVADMGDDEDHFFIRLSRQKKSDSMS